MKQVLSFLLSLVLMVGISTSAFAAGNTYHDVPASHWAYQYIESVTEKGLFGGVGGGKFSPETPFTRAQVTQTLYNAYSQALTGTLDIDWQRMVQDAFALGLVLQPAGWRL